MEVFDIPGLEDGFAVLFENTGNDLWMTWSKDDPYAILVYDFTEESECPVTFMAVVPYDAPKQSVDELYKRAKSIFSTCSERMTVLTSEEAGKRGLAPFAAVETGDDLPF
jgi:hypothetical protein